MMNNDKKKLTQKNQNEDGAKENGSVTKNEEKAIQNDDKQEHQPEWG